MQDAAELTTIRSEGGLFPPDLLQRVVNLDPELGGMAPADYGLEASDRLREAAARAWSKAKAYWAAFRASTSDLRPDESDIVPTRQQRQQPLLRDLGYRDVEYRAAAETIGAKRYPISHRAGSVPLHLVGFRQDVDRASRDHAGETRASPHALLQEYLNVSDSLYGIVSNGLVLRLLRDNASLTRQAYLEFNLEAMLEGGVYSDFVLLFLVLHRSRLPRPGVEARECWLERWREYAETRGTRALGELRKGVEQAITALGNGFLAHPANEALRRRLLAGELTVQQYYQQLLRLVYRLLFLFVAEERDLIYPSPEASRPSTVTDKSANRASALSALPGGRGEGESISRPTPAAEERSHLVPSLGGRGGTTFARQPGGSGGEGVRPDPANKRRYDAHYSASRLRRLARKYRADDRHDDLWRSLQITFQLVAGLRTGLDVPALGGGLFNTSSCPDLDSALLHNSALCEAIIRLSYVKVAKVTRWVSYRDLDVEELGGVYEGLLERQPSLRPDAAYPHFALVGSGQRKQTGSYYTPSVLVDELIRSALDPVIADRLKGTTTPAARRQALLGIAVCDPACGSGHFLLAAARRIAGELARVEAGDGEPGPEQLRAALREVIRHCIYGVDLNPLAVDLCRLALWLEGHDPGRPLAFLEHNVKVGNSLVGVFDLSVLAAGIPDDAYLPVADDDRRIASALKKRNRAERAGQTSAFALALETSLARTLETLATDLDTLRGLEEVTVADEQAKRDLYAEVRASRGAWDRQIACDLWTAAFFAPLVKPDPGQESLVPTTATVWSFLENPRAAHGQVIGAAQGLHQTHHFFHWPLEFPEVMRRGGFDCVLGNPPWEKVEMDEVEFFADHDPEIAALSGARRKSAIERLSETAPSLWSAFQSSVRQIGAATKFFKASERFRLTGAGRMNLYALFAELDRDLLSPRGRLGVIVPTGIATDDSTKRFFQSIVEQRSLATLFDFENRGIFFPSVHASYKFSLLSLSGTPVPRSELAFFLTSAEHLRDERRRFQLSADDFALLNPNTRTCPVFRTRFDADLTRAIYRRVPVLVDERTGANPWGVEFMQGLFNMTSDSHLFHDAPGPGLVPLYEAKLFHQFNHRWATYEDTDARDATPAELADPSWLVRPRYWVEKREVEARLAGRWDRGWLIAFRDIARATDERTAIFSVLPRVGAGHKGPLLLPGVGGALLRALVGNLNSICLDYVARQKVGGTNLAFFTLKQLPVLPPAGYISMDLDFIVPRVLELTYTAWDLKPFAEDLGYDGPPFRWDEERRALLRAELDAYYAALYGLARDELRYILDPQDVHGPDFPGETFRVLKERELKEYGEYRTRRLVLEAWDRLGLAPRNRDGRYEGEARATPIAAASDREKGANGRQESAAGTGWPARQRTLPSIGEAVQRSFADLEEE